MRSHDCPEVGLPLRVEEERATITGTDQFASYRAGVKTIVDPVIDSPMRVCRGATRLKVPLPCQRLAEAREIAGFKGRVHLDAELLYGMELIDKARGWTVVNGQYLRR